MIALVACEAEETFFQDGVAPIPEGQRKAHDLVPVADPFDSVLPPAIGARARVIVRKILPSRTARAVIFADGSPLALGEIGSPPLPMFFSSACFFKPAVFRGLDSWHRWLVLCARASYGRTFCEMPHARWRKSCPFRHVLRVGRKNGADYCGVNDWAGGWACDWVGFGAGA